MASKSRPLLALLACALLVAMSMAQDDNDPLWYWIMADSKDSAAVCPGRCLAVNDSASTGAYKNKQVGFVACKRADTSTSTSSSSDSGSTSNNNQQWLYTAHENETVIQINATGSGTDSQTNPELLCLQPDPAHANQSLTVTTCNRERSQKWNVADNTIASLAFNPPRYLAMTYRLATFLDGTDGSTAWREASFVAKAGNRSLTTTFSMVDGTADPQLPPPPPPPDDENRTFRNFIRNGDFEQSSSDFSPAMSNLTLQQDDIFGLCDWQIMNTEVNLQGSHPAPAVGNRSLYLKDGIVKQAVATSPGAFYSLFFKVHVATPSPADSSTTSGSSDESDACRGYDSLAVNPYPSTNVHAIVPVSNASWSTRQVSFQALGKDLQLSLKGCASCGCFVDDVNLMQILDPAPFPPPPPRPTPPGAPGYKARPPGDDQPPPFLTISSSKRLSNGAVVGLLVGAAALFFVIGAAFFAVVCVKEKKDGERDLSRPAEWSIQTTTPAQSERGKRSAVNSQSHPDGSNAPITPSSAPQAPSPHTSSTVGATKYSTSQSSTNPESGRGV